MHRLSPPRPLRLLVALAALAALAACTSAPPPAKPTPTASMLKAPPRPALRLPTSSSALLPGGRVTPVEVAPDALRFQALEIALDPQGRVPAAARQGIDNSFLIGDLHTALEEAARALPSNPWVNSTNSTLGPLGLKADRGTPYATVKQVMYTAQQAGFDVLEFHVAPSQGAPKGSVVRIAMPRLLLSMIEEEEEEIPEDDAAPAPPAPSPAKPAAAPPAPRILAFDIQPEGIVVILDHTILPPQPGCPPDARVTLCNPRPDAPTHADRYAWDALATLALTQLASWPADAHIVVFATDDTPLQTLLRLLDTLRFKPDGAPLMPVAIFGVK